MYSGLTMETKIVEEEKNCNSKVGMSFSFSLSLPVEALLEMGVTKKIYIRRGRTDIAEIRLDQPRGQFSEIMYQKSSKHFIVL